MAVGGGVMLLFLHQLLVFNVAPAPDLAILADSVALVVACVNLTNVFQTFYLRRDVHVGNILLALLPLLVAHSET